MEENWIHLMEGKEFSRLLYPNPVCFLCTPSDGAAYHANVMTVSWLTATNNKGKFVMSLNQHRHTATYMQHSGREFCLCVPVAGMESIVLAVGGTSGKWRSKWDKTKRGNDGPVRSQACMQHSDEESKLVSILSSSSSKEKTLNKIPSWSKRQRKRLEREAMQNGIPGLVRIPFGAQSCSNDNGSLFCIKGTVAHLRCRSYRIDENIVDEVDDEHSLIFAQVIDAYCHPEYWNQKKNLFCSKPGQAPFLSFLGSQLFGHVTAGSSNPESPRS